ncbi:MAG: prepilin-type N-terminal cleavage/methylation domain-containing protein [Alphaproteobacteria bacterium]|jgi:prepilin-type N-terminal cleavage/methylation domain-containing protein|nr:prepilin-type N-terminal cleavage/methylation domain-containing protein [Alphaproteobacteria bacterium]MBT5828003.1 prepilin-type N-terminal cleavage/methylation domain-containing protein [Alphaproteobacteria bacterium]
MKKNAFSLVELSIVLIIIGLLIAGVSSGSKLIEQAKINKAVSDLRDYKGSYLTFILTYDKIPGDMDDAVSFFGSGTANGDNDTQIETSAADTSESLLAWEHMALSEVISGSYSQAATGFHTAGTTGPKSSLSATCYAPVYDTTAAVNGLQVGTNAATVDCSGTTSLLALTVYKIDNKIDDGVGNSGDITATSAATDCQSSGTYDLDSTTKGCAFHYSFGDN